MTPREALGLILMDGSSCHHPNCERCNNLKRAQQKLWTLVVDQEEREAELHICAYCEKHEATEPGDLCRRCEAEINRAAKDDPGDPEITRRGGWI